MYALLVHVYMHFHPILQGSLDMTVRGLAIYVRLL